MKFEHTSHLINEAIKQILGQNDHLKTQSVIDVHFKASYNEMLHISNELDRLEKIETTMKQLEHKATAYDNAKEDLELAQAVKLIFKQRNIIAIEPSYDFAMNLDGSEDYISDAKELINWHREQKEGEHNEPK